MDAVTYPNEDVKKELDEHWLTTYLDVTEAEATAALFGVSAIPVAVSVTGTGEVLGRVLGFVEPEHFRQELETLRSKR